MLFFLTIPFLLLIRETKSRVSIYLFIVSSFVFGIVNASKALENDWQWFARHYTYIYENGLQSYFLLSQYGQGSLASVYGIAPKVTEPFSYFIASLAGIVSGGDVAFLAVVLTVLFYASVTFAVVKTASALRGSFAGVSHGLILGLFIGATATLVLHLIRQELALALLLAAWPFVLSKRYKWALVFLIASILSHNSIIVLIVPVLLGHWIVRSGEIRKAFFVFSVLLIIGLMTFVLQSSRVDNVKNDGSVSLLLLGLDFLILAAAIYARKFLPTNSRSIVDGIFASTILYLIAMVMASQVDLLFLRMYFYVDFFRILLLSIIAVGFSNVKLLKVSNLGLIWVVSLIFVFLRFSRSPFHFQMDPLALIFWPLPIS